MRAFSIRLNLIFFMQCIFAWFSMYAQLKRRIMSVFTHGLLYRRRVELTSFFIAEGLFLSNYPHLSVTGEDLRWVYRWCKSFFKRCLEFGGCMRKTKHSLMMQLKILKWYLIVNYVFVFSKSLEINSRIFHYNFPDNSRIE